MYQIDFTTKDDEKSAFIKLMADKLTKIYRDYWTEKVKLRILHFSIIFINNPSFLLFNYFLLIMFEDPWVSQICFCGIRIFLIRILG